MGAPFTVFFIGHEADSVFVSGLGFSPCDCVRMSITPAKQKEEALLVLPRILRVPDTSSYNAVYWSECTLSVNLIILIFLP